MNFLSFSRSFNKYFTFSISKKLQKYSFRVLKRSFCVIKTIEASVHIERCKDCGRLFTKESAIANGPQYLVEEVSESTVMSTHKSEDLSNRLHNGVTNGFGPKTPFLIGVAGGTASGKVNNYSSCEFISVSAM